MEYCNVCNQAKDRSDLTPTYVITKQEKEKDILICRPCVELVCDTIKVGEWFPLKSSDELVRLPNYFYMKL